MELLSWLPLVFWIFLWTYWFISAFRAKKSVHMKSFWVWQFGIRLVILALVLYIFRTGHGGVFTYLFSNQLSALLPASLLVSMLGVILCAAGVSFAVWARVHLGMNWGMPMSLREKPELVTSGPYQFVRHPIYSGWNDMVSCFYHYGNIFYLQRYKRRENDGRAVSRQIS